MTVTIPNAAYYMKVTISGSIGGSDGTYYITPNTDGVGTATDGRGAAPTANGFKMLKTNSSNQYVITVHGPNETSKTGGLVTITAVYHMFSWANMAYAKSTTITNNNIATPYEWGRFTITGSSRQF